MIVSAPASMTREDVLELLGRHKDALNRHDIPGLMSLCAHGRWEALAGDDRKD